MHGEPKVQSCSKMRQKLVQEEDTGQCLKLNHQPIVTEIYSLEMNSYLVFFIFQITERNWAEQLKWVADRAKASSVNSIFSKNEKFLFYFTEKAT